MGILRREREAVTLPKATVERIAREAKAWVWNYGVFENRENAYIAGATKEALLTEETKAKNKILRGEINARNRESIELAVQVDQAKVRTQRLRAALILAQRHLPKLDSLPFKTETEIGLCVKAIEKALAEDAESEEPWATKPRARFTWASSLSSESYVSEC